MYKNLAALDIGTNSFHLIIVSVSPDGNFKIIDRKKEVIRLSEGSTGDFKYITATSIERAISAISKFREIADRYGATLRGTATSAVRESLNKNEFIKAVYEKTGVEINVISGIEEARLIYLGVIKAIPLLNKETLSIDIGGGSTEFIVGNGGKIKYVNSLKLGSVRLTQKFFPNNLFSDKEVEETRKWVEEVLTPVTQNINNREIETFVGSSGTILNIGMMIKAMRNGKKAKCKNLNNFEFTFDEVQEIELLILSKTSPNERKKIAGLEKKRVDIISAGVIILSTIFRQLEIKKLIVSDYALREGLIFDEIDKLGFNPAERDKS